MCRVTLPRSLWMAGGGTGSGRTSAGPARVDGVTQALYRRYRPATFADVIGQDHVTGPLQQALAPRPHPPRLPVQRPARLRQDDQRADHGPLPQLRAGPDRRRRAACATRASALAPGGGGSLDVIEIDAATHGLVDDARDLRERAFFTPASSRYKIYIIDEAHMLTANAANALLKIVEEPPPHVKFVFATTEPEKVIATIRSRVHHYPFRLVPPGELTGLPAARSARRRASPPTAAPCSLVVRAGRGSVRDSMSILDQLVAGAPDERHHLRVRRRAARPHRREPARRHGRGVRGRRRRLGVPASSTRSSRPATTRAGSPRTCSSGCAT